MRLQFIYEISAEGNNASQLDFIGLHIEYGEKLGSEYVKSLAYRLEQDDVGTWKSFARAQAKELGSENEDREKP